MNAERKSRIKKKFPIRLLRILTYSLLFIWICEYFFLQPAKVSFADLSPPEPNLISLAENLRRHVIHLASPELQGRAPGTPGNAAAERYLLDRFREMGLVSPAPTGAMTQIVSADIGNNVFSALPEVKNEHDWLLLGAHFDHLGRVDEKDYLGADDNASSVAIMLETARRLNVSGPLNRYNLLFVGFNSEEPPYFLSYKMGSHHFYTHIKEIGIDPGKIRLAIIMDLMGGIFWEPLKDVFFVLGAEKSPELEAAARSITVPRLDARFLGMSMIENVPKTGERGRIFSDYQVFRTHFIPHLFLTSGRTPDYHRPSDTAEKLNYNRMARTVLWLDDLIRELDRMESGWSYQRNRENTLQDFNTLAPLVEQAAQWTTRIPQTGFISLYHLKQDRGRMENIGRKISGNQPLEKQDVSALTLASIRIQCLLGKMGLCFLLPGELENGNDGEG